MESVSIDKQLTFLYRLVFLQNLTKCCRYVTSWLEEREQAAEKTNLIILFDKYIPSCLENVRTRFKKITPVADISHIQTLCYLLDCLLTPPNVTPDCSKELYEMYFSFACIWAFGSAMFHDQVSTSTTILKLNTSIAVKFQVLFEGEEAVVQFKKQWIFGR